MRLTILNRSGCAVPRKFLKKWVRELESLAAGEIKRARSPLRKRAPENSFRGRELVLVFLAPDEARQLNKTYRKKDYATDVLSFSSDDPDALGELVICPQVISRQARQHGLLVREELGYMVLHGFLHLLGFDHERSKAEARLMFAIQESLFDRLLSRLS